MGFLQFCLFYGIDIVESEEGIIIKLKWTKTLQAMKGSMPVPLPALKGSLVFPRRAWVEYRGVLSGVTHSSSTPLLLTMVKPLGKVVTASGHV